jgi:glycosyltransferase involved in cell wall biosynthesis
VKQLGNHKIELILVDDGSTDDSVDIIKQFPFEIKFLHQKNQGPAAARNKGIQKATGKYLAFLDADDYWLPGFLENTVSFLEDNLDAIAVSVGQEHHLHNGNMNISPSLLNENNELRSIVLDDFFGFWAVHNHVCTGSVLMRTAFVKQTGGQRPELRITEDLEFWAFLATFGDWGFIPEVLFVSDGGAVTKSQGWWRKNFKRWSSAPSMKEWEKRILAKKPELKMDFGYRKASGRIAKNLSYSAMLSNRFELSRSIIQDRKHDFPSDKLSKILMGASKKKLIFFLIGNLLILRERFRII